MKETSTGVYFWGGYLSQWFKVNFTENFLVFGTAEQYMMYHKALLFGDKKIAQQILNTNDPKKQKALGRQVDGFNDKIWNEQKLNIVIQGNYLKFSQNPQLEDALLATGNKLLVEGSPYDNIWGVALKYDDPKILDEKNWKGQNLLGKALMEVRTKLRDKDK